MSNPNGGSLRPRRFKPPPIGMPSPLTPTIKKVQPAALTKTPGPPPAMKPKVQGLNALSGGINGLKRGGKVRRK